MTSKATIVVLAVFSLVQVSSAASTTTASPTTPSTTTTSLVPAQIDCYTCNSRDFNGCGNCFKDTGLSVEFCVGQCITKATYEASEQVLMTVERTCSTSSSTWLNECQQESSSNNTIVCYTSCNTNRCNNQAARRPTTFVASGRQASTVHRSRIVQRNSNSVQPQADDVYVSCISCDTTTRDGCGTCYNETGLDKKFCFGKCKTAAFYKTTDSGSYVLTTVERVCTTEPNLESGICTSSGDTDVTCYETCSDVDNSCNNKAPLDPSTFGISTANRQFAGFLNIITALLVGTAVQATVA